MDIILYVVFEFLLFIASVFALWQIFLSYIEVKYISTEGENLFIEYFHRGKKCIPLYKKEAKIYKVKKRQLKTKKGAFRPMRLVSFKNRQFALLTVDQAREIFQ